MISTDVNTAGAGPAGARRHRRSHPGRPVILPDQAAQQKLGRRTVSGHQSAHAISYVKTQGASR
ncbi:hypothetical protein [Streptomyces sp. NPDC055794]